MTPHTNGLSTDVRLAEEGSGQVRRRAHRRGATLVTFRTAIEGLLKTEVALKN
jgi:hypothetical protein